MKEKQEVEQGGEFSSHSESRRIFVRGKFYSLADMVDFHADTIWGLASFLSQSSSLSEESTKKNLADGSLIEQLLFNIVRYEQRAETQSHIIDRLTERAFVAPSPSGQSELSSSSQREDGQSDTGDSELHRATIPASAVPCKAENERDWIEASLTSAKPPTGGF